MKGVPINYEATRFLYFLNKRVKKIWLQVKGHRAKHSGSEHIRVVEEKQRTFYQVREILYRGALWEREDCL